MAGWIDGKQTATMGNRLRCFRRPRARPGGAATARSRSASTRFRLRGTSDAEVRTKISRPARKVPRPRGQPAALPDRKPLGEPLPSHRCGRSAKYRGLMDHMIELDAEKHPNHEPSPWLSERLTYPAIGGGWADAAAHWRVTTVTVKCAQPRELEPGIWMPWAVRGAVGSILFDVDLPRNDRASAYQALMAPSHLMVQGRWVPAPLLIDVFAGDSQILITARLFGFADLWLDTFIGALVLALNGGVRLRYGGHERAPWPVLDFSYVRGIGVPTVFGPSLLIRPLTPLCYGSQAHVPHAPERWLVSAITRATLIARWQGFRVDRKVPDAENLAENIRIIPSALQRVERFGKRSRRHAGATIEVTGERTELLLRNVDKDIAAALSLASTTGAGGHTAFGFGRFVLLVS